MNDKTLHNCFCGCRMFTYKHGVGPHVNVIPDTHTFVKYGIYGNHAKDCIFAGSELKNTFDSEEEAIKAWNKLFE